MVMVELEEVTGLQRLMLIVLQAIVVGQKMMLVKVGAARLGEMAVVEVVVKVALLATAFEGKGPIHWVM